MRRVGEEHELWRIHGAGYVLEAPVPIEERGEQVGVLRLAALARVAELMPPTEVHERVHVRLRVVVEGVARRVIRYLKARARRVQVEAEHVVGAGRELDLPEAEVIGALVMKVHDLGRRGIEHHRLPAHVAELTRSGEEEAPRTRVRAHTCRLAVEAAIARRRLRVVAADVRPYLAVKSPGGDAGCDVDDRRVLVAVFRVPAASLEVDLIHDL